ncbi:Hypp5446 [Branchiostoma lanceolatum]|uniref:Hypp5446 protein n=1 Tax=Branchiostoma lanceolatum TaxID=7740 RepID=A0A8J9VHF9_BRALA|nr:Hypp5446 [Branchiostoma lanceolatum]
MRAVACREYADDDVLSIDSLTPEAAAPTDLHSLDISRPRDTAKSAEGKLINNENIGTQSRPLCSYVFLRNIGKQTSTGTTKPITVAPPAAGRDGIALRQGRHGNEDGVTGSHAEKDVSGIKDKKRQNKLGRRVTLNVDSLREVFKMSNVLARKRREAVLSSANDVTVRRSVSVRESLISRACCRAGRHFGGNPEIAECSEASGRFVSGNIAVLTDLREICVGHFVVCCNETQDVLKTTVPLHKPSQPVPKTLEEITDNQSEEETEDEDPLPAPPTDQNTQTSAKSAVQLAYTCCLNGRSTAYNFAKRCEDERDAYLNKTARDALHTAEALAGCRMEFGRCCEAQRDALKSTGERRSPTRKNLATLRGLQLKQHCCRKGSIQGLAPETECTQSAREFAWRPLKRSPGRRAQCSGEYKHCCALRQEQNKKVVAIRTARKRWQQRDTVSPTVATPTQTRDIGSSSKRPSQRQSSVAVREKGTRQEVSKVENFASTATSYFLSNSTEESRRVNSRRASSEDSGSVEKSSRAGQEHPEKSTRIGSRDQADGPALPNNKRMKSSSNPTTVSDVQKGVRSPTRSERSRKAAKSPKSSTKGRRRTRRRNRVVRTRAGSPAQLQNYGARPSPTASPDVMDVLASNRRALRLCCMHGGRVDPNVFQPRACSREADSYVRGTGLTGPVRKVCKEVYEHCCQAGNETHPGHGQHPGHDQHPGHHQHPGHGGAIRSPGRKTVAEVTCQAGGLPALARDLNSPPLLCP